MKFCKVKEQAVESIDKTIYFTVYTINGFIYIKQAP